MPFRHDDEERALLVEVQRVYGGYGLELSLNDVLRHLVRRAGIVLTHTPTESREALRVHYDECKLCAEAESGKFGCPEGVYLHRNHLRVVQSHPWSPEA